MAVPAGAIEWPEQIRRIGKGFKMAKVQRYSEEKRAFFKKPVFVTAAALISASVLFAGCSYIQDNFFPTTVYETESTTQTGIQLSVDPDAVVSPESIGEASFITTTETTIPSFEGAFYRQIPEVPSELTVDSFAAITEDKKLEDLEKEFGPWARQDGRFYVWILADRTEVWVDFFDSIETYPDSETPNVKEPSYTVRNVFHIDGIEQTLLCTYYDNGGYSDLDWFDYKLNCLVEREFGPELENGWYLLEKDDAYYIIISAGRREVRDSRTWLFRCRLEKFDIGGELLTVDIDTDYFPEERPEIGPYPYPCCGIKIDKLPPDIIVQTRTEKRIPFKGLLVLEDE